MAAILRSVAVMHVSMLNGLRPISRQMLQHQLQRGLTVSYPHHQTDTKKESGSPGYTIRQGRRDDIPGMFRLVCEAGWNHTIDHLHTLFDFFPEGVFVADSAEGEIISQCASHSLDARTGMLSYYVTKESLRGQGIGRQVFDLSHKALGKRNVSGNGVMDHLQMYTNGIYKITTSTLQILEFPLTNTLKLEREGRCSRVVDIKEVDPQRIVEYDKKIHPMPREKVLKWTLGYCTVGRVAVAGDEIKGWGALCKRNRGYCLMPLYSDTPDVAHDLAQELLMQISGKQGAEIEICIPEENMAAKKLLSDIGVFHGEYQSFKLKRMFTDYDIPVPTHLVYSFMNYEQVLA